MNIGNEFRFDLWLYNEMQKRGFNKTEMAEASGVSIQAIMHYLNNKRLPTLRTLIAILDAFDMRIDFVSR